MPHWRECSAEEFYNFFAGIVFRLDPDHERFINSLSNLSSESEFDGRCFVAPRARALRAVAVYEKGIFVGEQSGGHIQGVVESASVNAARERFKALSIHSDSAWIKESSEKAFGQCVNTGEMLSIQEFLLSIGRINEEHPLFLIDRKIVSLRGLAEEVERQAVAVIRLKEDGEDEFSWKAVEKIAPIIGLKVDPTRIYSLVDFPVRISSPESIEDLIAEEDGPLAMVCNRIIEAMKGAQVQFEHTQRRYGDSTLDLIFKREG